MSEVKRGAVPEGGLPPINICPDCGARFTCGMNAGNAQCWCASLPAALAVPDMPGGSTTGCYCPDCLARRVNGDPGPVTDLRQ